MLFIFSTLLFINCEKEEETYSNSIKNHHSKEKIKRIYKDEIFQNQKLLRDIDNVNQSIKNNKNSKTIYSSDFDFYIDTDFATYIENEDGTYHSYTFTIIRQNQNTNLENLVFSLNPDGSYKTVIVSYDLTLQEKIKISEGITVNLAGKISSTIIDGTSLQNNIFSKVLYSGGIGDCLGYVVIESSYCGCNEESHATNLSGCQCVVTTYDRECFGCGGTGSGDSAGDTVNNDNTDGGGSSTSGGGSSGGGSVTTSPTTVDFEKERKKCFQSQYPEENNWLNQPENTAIKTAIFNYLKSTANQEDFISTDSCYPDEAINFVIELMDLATLESNQEEASKLVQLSIMFETSDDIFSEEFSQSILPFTNINTSNWPPGYPLANLSISTFLKYKQLRQLNPGWSRAKCIWYATKEMIHIGLDVFGMVPLIGEPADIINGVLYTIEGDTLNATLSYAGAVPLAGWAAVGVKYAVKINEVAVIATKVKLVWKVAANGLIEFGSRNQLRKVLGLLPGNPSQAHHIMPWTDLVRNHDVVQKAAKSGSAFHMNEALNGIAVAAWRNQPNHNTYNNLIKTRLDNYINVQNPNATPQECYDFVYDLIQDIRDWVISHPNSHLNDLVLP